MDGVRVVVAHEERTTLRVGDVFLKVDADPARTEREAEVMARVPIPTPELLWRKPSVLALAALPGAPLGRLGTPSTASPQAWAAAGAAVRTLHGAPLPPWPGRSPEALAEALEQECRWLVADGTLPDDVVAVNARIAGTVVRDWDPVFVHGDLQVDHVFVDGDEVTGVLDWSEGAPGDALWDLATLTVGHPERLDDVLAGYGADVDPDLVRAWWSVRGLLGVRWLLQHGFDAFQPGCEADVLLAAARRSGG